MLRKSKKKFILLGVGVAVAAVLVWRVMTPAPVEEVYHTVTPLGRMDLQSTVDVTGNVQSARTVSVYSSQSYPVRSVAVEVGDTVEEGQLLCELDSASLLNEIAVSQANIGSSSRSAALTLEQAQGELERARVDQAQDGADAVRDAEDALREAREAVEEAERQLRQAQLSTNLARDNLEEARKDYRDSDGDGSRALVNSARGSLNQALISEEDAESKLALVESKVPLAEEKLERARREAQDLDLASYEDRIETARLAGDLSAEQLALARLQQNLAECTVTAPAAGTVTSVHAVVGDSGSGLLFVIEDTDNLEVSTNVKEYDIGAIMLGDKVLIKSDGARGEVYEGELVRIAPSTSKASVNSITGEKEITTDAEYAAEVRITSAGHRLLIGMSTRLSIIVDERVNVFAVSYDLLSMNELGEECLYIAEPQEDGSYLARVIPVTVGLETDFYSELIAEGLEEGMLIISDAAGLSDGEPVNIAPPMGMEMGL